MRFAVALTAALLALTGTAQAAGPPLGSDGETAPTYDYASALRQRVFVPTDVDTDGNGINDHVAVDIIRPNAPGPFPAIVDASPYLTSLCRGLKSECMGDPSGDGVNDRWPLFLDNYFVPRGYAVVLAQMGGTGYNTDGCPLHGSYSKDIAGLKSVIQWLNTQPWHNGSSAMIGKSYDGTLANGVAATGVAGLKTIVPESAISDWYDYSRTGGITTATNYPSFLDNAIMQPSVAGAPDRRSACTAINTGFNTADGDDTGDRNAFWDDRNYLPHVGDVKAAVFAVHGFQDDNVTMSQLWPWWNGLKANGVPLKLWLLRAGHTDPFDSRRAVWVDTLHRWFDHWLYGVDNGIMDEPRVTIEDSKDAWGEYADWPVPGTSNVDVFLRGTDSATAGALRGAGGASGDAVAFVGRSGNPPNADTTYVNTPTGAQTERHVFLSPPLATDVRLSGRAVLDLQATLEKSQSNLGVIVVDYSATPFTETTRNGEGIQQVAGTCTDWGPSTTYDNACYLDISKPLQTISQWRVTRGILDSSNRNSLSVADPVTPGQPYAFPIPTEPTEHTFAAGHQIGVIVVGNLLGTAGTASTQVTIDTALSKIELPIVGGAAKARASGLTDAAAPTTAASPSTGWISAKAVTLSASDGDGSGIASITYSVNGGASTTVTGDRASVPVADGDVALRFAATDRAGNAEGERTLTLHADSVAPTITLTPPKATVFARGAVVAIGHACADDRSGIASCSGPARLDTTKAGSQTATFMALDAAGNAATAAFSYRVLGALPKLKLATKGGRRLVLTSPVAASVRIRGVKKAVTLTAGVPRTVKLRAKPGRVKLKLVIKAGTLTRTERVTVRVKR